MGNEAISSSSNQELPRGQKESPEKKTIAQKAREMWKEFQTELEANNERHEKNRRELYQLIDEHELSFWEVRKLASNGMKTPDGIRKYVAFKQTQEYKDGVSFPEHITQQARNTKAKK